MLEFYFLLSHFTIRKQVSNNLYLERKMVNIKINQSNEWHRKVLYRVVNGTMLSISVEGKIYKQIRLMTILSQYILYHAKYTCECCIQISYFSPISIPFAKYEQITILSRLRISYYVTPLNV